MHPEGPGACHPRPQLPKPELLPSDRDRDFLEPTGLRDIRPEQWAPLTEPELRVPHAEAGLLLAEKELREQRQIGLQELHPEADQLQQAPYQ